MWLLGIIIFVVVNGEVFYVSKSGSDSNNGKSVSLSFLTVSHGVTTMGNGDSLLIRSGTYNGCPYMIKSGLSNDQMTVISNYQDEEVILDGGSCSGIDNVIVHVYRKENVRVNGLKVINSVGYGIMSACSDNVVIENNYIENTQASGIWIHGDTWCDGTKEFQNNNFVIFNNTLVDVNMGPWYDQEGISVSMVNNFTVTYNKVYGSKKESLDIKQGSSNGIVAYNYLECNVPWMDTEYNHPVLYIDAFEKFVRNVEFYGNIIVGRRMGLAIATEVGGVIENVVIKENIFIMNEQFGLAIVHYNTAGSHMKTDITITNNVFSCLDCLTILIMEEGSYYERFQVTNNILIGSNQNVAHTEFKEDEWVFSDNISNRNQFTWESSKNEMYLKGSVIQVNYDSTVVDLPAKNVRISVKTPITY